MTARPRPQKDPEAVAHLVERAREARARLPELAREIEDLVRRVDPMELLSQLTLLFQTHPETEQPNRDEAVRWQVRLEWLTWLVFARGLTSPPQAEVIDGRILDPLDRLLGEYVVATTMAIPAPVEGLTEDENDVRALIQLEAIHVRGEAFQSQIERMADELYQPHERWCLEHLGFRVQDAFALAKTIFSGFSERLHAHREAEAEIRRRVAVDPAVALTLGLPPRIHDSLATDVPTEEREDFAKTIGTSWFFARAAHVVGFSSEDLQSQVVGEIERERVEAFLDFASVAAGDVRGEPDLLALPPLAASPLVRYDGRFYLFVPGVLFEALFYSIHGRLFGDAAYRPTYDAARAQWLERTALDAFTRMLPNAESAWSLSYGPKKARLELDGLIRYDNKLILLECKWKTLTLSARSGNVVVALKDVDKAILQPLAQARRARDYIARLDAAEFVEGGTGRRIVVRRADVADVFLVTLVGTGAWSQIAANLVRLAPLGLFADGEYPWALSVNDLSVVADCVEFPSQLFDYLRRRYEVQREPRFRFHDEWDLLGVYLAGALDIRDPRFKDADFVALDGFDSDLQDYYYSQGSDVVTPERPRRPVPQNLKELLLAVERAPHPLKTDAICVVLSWPNWGLDELGKSLREARRKTVWDGKAHAVAVGHPWRNSGVSFCCGFRNRRAIQETLWTACESQRRRTGAQEWAGFGIDLDAPTEPIVFYYESPDEAQDDVPRRHRGGLPVLTAAANRKRRATP